MNQSSPISDAFSKGYNPEQIIKFLMRAFPFLTPKIKKAAAAGYSLDKILSFLDKTSSHAPSDHFSSEQQVHRRNDLRDERLTTDLMKAGAGALASYAALRAAPALSSQSSPPSASPPSIGPTPMANAPVSPPPISPTGVSPTPQSSPAAAINPKSVAAAPFSPAKKRASEFLTSLGMEQRVKELAQKGKSPEEIASDLQMSMHPSTRKAYLAKRARGEEIPISQHVKEYLTNPEGFLREDVFKMGESATSQKNTQTDQSIQKTEIPLSSEERQATPIERGQIVSTSDGKVGKIKDIKDTQALIEEDGKTHRVNVDDLVASPIPEKDLTELFDELNQEIEKETGEQISRAVRFVGYNPEQNRLLFIPWEGGPYMYDDISQEDIDVLTKILHKRKTTGQSLIGWWEEGTKSPMGSQMSKLIRKLQEERGGKGKEYTTKFSTVYDPGGIPIEMKRIRRKKKRSS